MRKSNLALKNQLPETITQELQLIQSKNNGLLEPAHIVEYAKDPETLLHGRFEWEDSKAAEKYRVWQARQIIRLELVVVNKQADKPSKLFFTIDPTEKAKRHIRAFVSLQSDRYGDGESRGGYRDIYDVVLDDEMRAQLLDDAKKDMGHFRRKYQLLKELSNVFEAMDKVT